VGDRQHTAVSATGGSRRRVRRSVDEARKLILEAAERKLVDGGPDAVRIQTVAADVGVSDAAVHYHFGTRDALLEAVIKSAGRRMRDDLVAVVESWRAGEVDLHGLVDRLRETMEREGQSRLTAWMVLGGWRPQGRGLLRPMADEIHERRRDAAGTAGERPPRVDDTLSAIALLGLVVWGEPLMGDAWRRAVGLPADRAGSDAFLAWAVELIADHLGTP
jgi:AcrR family transcriptional regulator